MMRHFSPNKLFNPIVGLVIILLGLHFLTGACAQITPLEGGPMDTIPPQLISTFPIHESTNFKQKELRLEFDKEIEVQDIYNRLIITPKLAVLEDEPSYTYTVRDKTLRLAIHSPLEEATTYTFNFKDAIKDTKEGTPAINPTLTFSTGDYLDDRYVAGTVKQLMTDQPAASALVSLYRVPDDLTADTLHILNSSPDYFTQTNQEGAFELPHIKAGRYRIYAGKSEENKVIIDPHKEPYGFLQDPIDLNESVEGIQLAIVEADATPLSLQGKQPQGPWFELGFSKAIVKYELKLLHRLKRFKEGNLYSNLVEEGKTIRVYNTLGLLAEDSVDASLKAEDAMGNMLEDTVSINFREGVTSKEPFKLDCRPSAGTPMKPYFFEGTLTLNKPIRKIQSPHIFFMANEQKKIPIHESDIELGEHRDTLTMRKVFDPGLFAMVQQTDNQEKAQPSLSLHCDKGAFLSVENDPNEATNYKYGFKDIQQCGTIKGKIITQAPGFIIQLLNEQNEVVDELRNEAAYVFQEVLPGNYRIRVLGLRAPDAAWQFGNIEKGEMPDPVVFYPHELPIVANWELDYIDVLF